MSEKIARLYGVSYGNGNNGVSHMFPAFYVETDKPYQLAELALIGEFKYKYKETAYEAAIFDGEAKYTLYATILNPLDEEEHEEDESYCDANGAWFICEVFPEDEPREGTPRYASLAEAFSAEDIALHARLSNR